MRSISPLLFATLCPTFLLLSVALAQEGAVPDAPPGAADDARWMRYSDGVWIAPWITLDNHPNAVLRVISTSVNQLNVALTEQNGKEDILLAKGTLSRSAGNCDHLALTVTANAGGSFHIGQRIRGTKLSMIDSERTTYAAGNESMIDHYYPYNWKGNGFENIGEQTGGTARQKGASTVSIDLALPGVLLDGLHFVQASNEISLQHIVTGKEYAEARLMLTRPVLLPTGDEGRTDFEMKQGETVSVKVIVSKDLKAIQDEKWGVSAPMNQKMGVLQMKGWAIEGYNLPKEELTKIAREMAKGYDVVNFRTMDPQKWIVDIFKAESLKIYLYQYWGAVRTLDKEGTQLPKGVKPEWVLRETGEGPNGRGCRAPFADGGWQLLNVRNPEVRQYFVDIARRAVADGWDGVFYDGPYFWADHQSRTGGNGALDGQAEPISYSLARAKMTLEIKQAIEAINPKAKLGILAPRHYFDQLHIADYVDRENTNTYWAFSKEIPDLANPEMNRAEYSPSLAKDWMEKERPLIKTNLCYGTKSINPLLVTSAIYWADDHPKNLSIDDGDFWSKDGVHFAELEGEVGQFFGSNRIQELVPDDTIVYGTGLSLIEVSKSVSIRLAHPAAAFDLTNARYLGHSSSYQFEPHHTYAIAERHAGDCLYSGERLAWFADDLYLTGDIRFLEPPQKLGNSLAVRAEGLKGGRVQFRCPGRPKAILSKGVSIPFHESAGYWEFKLPTSPGELKIDL